MKTLIAITGPTGVGKTEVAIELASALHTEIISADSRQVYRDIPIITAAPTPDQLERVRHHFVGTLPLDAYFSAALFEEQALQVLARIFGQNDYALACGGSMMYVDALCHGIDPLPTISPQVREATARQAEQIGLDGMLALLRELDPEYFGIVDRKNLKRVVHAVEIIRQSGHTFTSLRSGLRKTRDFRVLKICLTAPREILFERINARVIRMAEEGMVEEARKVYPLRHLNSLNTVGCKEMFEYISGRWDLDFALARLQKNTRVYAKKQLTWYARDPEVIRIDTTLFPTPAALAAHILSML